MYDFSIALQTTSSKVVILLGPRTCEIKTVHPLAIRNGSHVRMFI